MGSFSFELCIRVIEEVMKIPALTFCYDIAKAPLPFRICPIVDMLVKQYDDLEAFDREISKVKEVEELKRFLEALRTIKDTCETVCKLLVIITYPEYAIGTQLSKALEEIGKARG